MSEVTSNVERFLSEEVMKATFELKEKLDAMNAELDSIREDQDKFEDLAYHQALGILKRSSNILYDIAKDDEHEHDFSLVFNEYRNVKSALEILQYFDGVEEN